MDDDFLKDFHYAATIGVTPNNGVGPSGRPHHLAETHHVNPDSLVWEGLKISGTVDTVPPRVWVVSSDDRHHGRDAQG